MIRSISIRRRFLVAAMLLSLSIPVPVLAEGPGWTANSTVKRLVVTADGGINVLLSPQPTSCVSNSGYGTGFASVYPNHPGISRIQAELLAAYLTATPVALYYVDNTCRVGEMTLGGW
jgi:hypothetical protein